MKRILFSRQVFAQEFVRRLLKSGFRGSDLARLRYSGPFWANIISLVVRYPSARRLVTDVDYSLTVEAAIALGAYDFTYGEVNSRNFPHTQKAPARIRQTLLCFGEILETPDVLGKIHSAGFRPSTLHELLAIGAQYPDEQRKYPIVGLGSVWFTEKGFHGVGCLEGYVRRRRLDPAWLEGWWRPEHRFAVVKLSTPS